MRTSTKELILRSFEAISTAPFNPNRVLVRFAQTLSHSGDGSSNTLCISSNNWRLAGRCLRQSVNDVNSIDARALRATLHHLLVDNQLLKIEVSGSRAAAEVKKKHSDIYKALLLSRKKKMIEQAR